MLLPLPLPKFSLKPMPQPMPQAAPIRQDLLLVGGGHSHAIVLQMWAMQPLPGVRLTLVSDQTHTPYSGMLPGHVAGFYDFDDCHIDLRRLCQAAGAQFYLDRAIGLDLERYRLSCADHPAIAFDYLSLDIGSTPAAVNVPGAKDYAIPAKPVPQFLQRWEALLASLQPEPRALSLGVVGGGAGGVELTISLLARLRQVTPNLSHQLHLFQRGGSLLPHHAPRVGRKFLAILQGQGVQVHLHSEVEAIHRHGTSASPLQVHHAQGVEPCDQLFWVTQASAPPWLAAAGLATDGRGFVRVGDSLQSCSHPRILAAGDIAAMVNHPRPKAGVFAVRQGRPLFETLQRLLQGQEPRPFAPQRQLLALIGTGTGEALASWGRWSLGPSRLLWGWKDWIDRRFMARFSQLPVMKSPSASLVQPGGGSPPPASPLPGGELPVMYCSGCGAKVGSGILHRTLERLRVAFPALILENADDAAVLHWPSDRPLIQTVDYFTSLVSDPFVFGQITANHCLNDLFAMGAVPHSAMALVQVPHGADGPVEETLYQLLSGALKVLAQSDCLLVGGHTIEGPELAFGLSCNGMGEPKGQGPGQSPIWRKGGLQPGQALILTKALGTGTLFAAAALGRTKGRWLDGAIATMLQSNAGAMAILRRHGTTACTDVTGFGLLGHLGEMVKASGVGVALELGALPLLAGADQTLGEGLASSMARQNAQAQHWVSNWPPDPNRGQDRATDPGLVPHMVAHTIVGPRHQILFDPQTAGGLLAALPLAAAEGCLAQLQAQGYGQSRIIGRSLAAGAQPCIRLVEALELQLD